MKRLILSLAFVLGLTPTIWSDEASTLVDGTAVEMCDVGCVGCGGYFAGAELTVLKPHTGALAIPIVGAALPEHDWGAGGRYWLGRRDGEGLGVRARFWHFDESSDLGGGDEIGFEAKTLDAELTQLMAFCGFELDFSVGFRWGEFTNTFTPAGFVEDFDGYGTTVSLFGHRALCGTQLAVVGGARASLLYGDHGVQVLGFPVNITNEVLPVWEIQAGIERQSVLSNGANVFVRLMVESQLWESPPALLGLGDQNFGLFGLGLSVGITR